MRLRSPLGGFLQSAGGASGGGEYSHTIDTGRTGLLRTADGGLASQDPQKDESDLGDLEDEDDSRTLFH